MQNRDNKLTLGDCVKQFVTYEQPLNERIRTFLRLEVLMKRLHSAIEGEETWRTHCALTSLLEIVNLVNRVDVKNDLMLELDRQAANITRLNSQSGVDQHRLQEVLERLRHLSRRLHEMSGQLAQHLMRNELLSSIKQRMGIPGGTCDFDLPAYHFWLSRSAEQRQQVLRSWTQPFDQVMEATELVLGLVRDSAVPTEQIAAQGFFQQMLNLDSPTQILRVKVDASLPVYPEISAGKHRFTIRFLGQSDIETRATQVTDDVHFELSACAL